MPLKLFFVLYAAQKQNGTSKRLAIHGAFPCLLSFIGCPISKFPLCFCHFLGFWSTYRGTSDLYSTALEICYMIATRIFKFDLEIAEIIEVKVGTRHLEINILLLQSQKK